MEFNIFFYVIFFIATTASFNDILIYLTKLDYGTSIIISLIAILLINIFFIKKKKIKLTVDFNKFDIFLFIVTAFVTVRRGIAYPDYTYDVFSYHIYLQQNPFIDKINFDFFPGRFYCDFLFPLGDRMFYIFRYFLGYRVGTILSFYLPIPLFYQVKRLLKHFGQPDSKASLASYFVTIVSSFVFNVGTYYIDNLGTVILLETVIIVIKNKDTLLKNKFALFILNLIFGFTIAIKVTNILFVLPLILYILVVNKDKLKEIKISTIIICAMLMILPVFVYAFDNIKQTGSILFPYYNKFLKSEFYALENWKDLRFGIKGIFAKIFWPIIVNVIYMYGDESHFHDYSWVIGYIFIIGFIIKNFKKKEKDVKFDLAIISIVYLAEWVLVLEGYMRYGILIPMIWSILLLDAILNKIQIKYEFKEIYKPIYKMLYFASIVIVFISAAVYNIKLLDTKNLKYIFKDIERKQTPIHIDGVWGSTYDCSGYESLIREEGTPIYTLHKGYFLNTPKTLSMWYEKIKDKDIYVVINYYGGTLKDYHDIKYLERQNFEIVDIIGPYTADDIPYINTNGFWYILKVKYKGSTEGI